MKHKIILIITLFSLFSSAFAQNVDWVNAPKNPLPIGVNLDKTQLKGDVFQYNLTFYDTNGKRIDLEKGKYISYDQLNRPISITYPSGTIREYKYDASGNLIYDDGIIYKYDNQNRIIKANYKWEIVEYSYTKQGDIIIVTMVHKAKDKAPTTEIEYYNKGVLTARKKSKESIKTFFKYKYDEKGNLIESIETDAAGNLISQDISSIIYHSEYKEFNKNAVLKKTTGDLSLKGGIAMPHLYINGKLDFTSLWDKFNNDYIFYNPLTSKYYLAKNAFNESIALNQNIPFEPLIEGENILVSDGKTALLVEQGQSALFSDRKWEIKTEYKNLIAIDTKSNDAYFAENAFVKTNNETKAYPAISMTNKGSEVWYILNKDKSLIAFYHKGKKVSVTYKGNIANTQDQVYAVNGVATYVAQDFSNAKPLLFNIGRYFNPSNDKLATSTSNTNSNISQNKSSTTSCISGNCTNGYGELKTDEYILKGFFKNGKANGFGKQTFSDNANYYEGNFIDGFRNGFGMFIWHDTKQYYIGQFKNGMFHGYGYVKKGGEILQAGYYEKGKQTRNMITPNFKNKRAVGSCIGNCNNGFGFYQFANRDTYVGFFTNGQIDKVGAYGWSSGDSYIGEIQNKNFSGQGVQYYKSTSTTYYGHFSTGQRHGLGVYLNKNKQISSKGYWVNGSLKTPY